jgi:hypothetical protein
LQETKHSTGDGDSHFDNIEEIVGMAAEHNGLDGDQQSNPVSVVLTNVTPAVTAAYPKFPTIEALYPALEGITVCTKSTGDGCQGASKLWPDYCKTISRVPHLPLQSSKGLGLYLPLQPGSQPNHELYDKNTVQNFMRSLESNEGDSKAGNNKLKGDNKIFEWG